MGAVEIGDEKSGGEETERGGKPMNKNELTPEKERGEREKIFSYEEREAPLSVRTT